MRPIPDIMSHPKAVATVDHYRAEYLVLLARVSQMAGNIDESAVTSTSLACAFGMLDAAICSLMAFHVCDGSAFDAGQFMATLQRRLELCQSIVERGQCEGGVQ